MILAILVGLIFIRPFISSLAFPCLNSVHSILLLVALAGWIIVRGIPLSKIKELRYPLLFFVFSLAASILLAMNRYLAMQESYKYASGLLLFLAALSLKEEEKTRLIRAIILAGFIISLLAIYQYFFGFPRLLNYVTKKGISDNFVLDYIARRRVYFPFVTPNTLAGYLILIVPLTLMIKDRKKLLILLPILLALFLAKSLGALLSLFLGLAVYFYLKRGLSKKEISLLIITALILMLIFILRQVQSKEYTLPSFSFIRRLDYWQEALRVINLHPLKGIGLGNFNLTQSRYAHNSYLQLWAEMGLIGIISFFWLVIAALRTYKNQNPCLLSAAIIFLLHNFVDFTFFLPEVSLIWWVILGSL